jgi:hypothetical protein
MADKIKTIGFKYATRGALSIGIQDLQIPSRSRRSSARPSRSRRKSSGSSSAA